MPRELLLGVHSRTLATNFPFVIGTLLLSMKKAPGWSPLAFMAATGHSWQPERPTSTSVPVPNWSHLDFRRWNFTIVAAKRSLIAMSPQLRCRAGSYAVSVSTNSSPRWKKPKNADVAIAQYAVLSVWAAVSSGLCIRRGTVTVIGRRALGWLAPHGSVSPDMPSMTCFNNGE